MQEQLQVTKKCRIIGFISYFASKFSENRIHGNAKTYDFADELSNDVKRPGVKHGLFRYT